MIVKPIDRWKRLKKAGAGDGVIEVPSIDSGISTGFGNVRYAIGPHGQPRLLIPAGEAIIPEELKSTTRLALLQSRFKLYGKSTRFIDVMCMDGSLDAVFAELAEEILRRITDGYQPAKAIADAVGEFRALLEEDKGTLSDSAIKGLVGELEILRRLAIYSVNAVSAWVGPQDQRHDFRRGLHALEVKTSGRADSTCVSIHGIDQLAPPAGGTLHLIHLRLEPAEGSLSVKSLVSGLIKLGVDKVLLWKNLELLGCSDPYSEDWNRLTYVIDKTEFYEVTDGFPRITSASFPGAGLPAGLSGVTYQLDLASANAFQLSECKERAVLERIAI